jgi:hypothetical protein
VAAFVSSYECSVPVDPSAAIGVEEAKSDVGVRGLIRCSSRTGARGVVLSAPVDPLPLVIPKPMSVIDLTVALKSLKTKFDSLTSRVDKLEKRNNRRASSVSSLRRHSTRRRSKHRDESSSASTEHRRKRRRYV